MYSKRYFYINKYFAFAFMVFAVMSGVSDSYNSTGAVKSKDGNFAYFLKINQLFIQSSSKITSKVFSNKYNAFKEYVQDIMAENYNNVICLVISNILFFAAFCLNNIIAKNNIWRKAVF